MPSGREQPVGAVALLLVAVKEQTEEATAVGAVGAAVGAAVVGEGPGPAEVVEWRRRRVVGEWRRRCPDTDSLLSGSSFYHSSVRLHGRRNLWRYLNFCHHCHFRRPRHSSLQTTAGGRLQPAPHFPQAAGQGFKEEGARGRKGAFRGVKARQECVIGRATSLAEASKGSAATNATATQATAKTVIRAILPTRTFKNRAEEGPGAF